MTFLTWNPWREMEALRREVERAFDSFGGGRANPLVVGPALAERFARSYVLTILLPKAEKAKPKKISVNVN
ncbi:MAG: hypothetical protein NTZ09_14715 [Candidatus Hydrogenedentes bacterium]|nr:hypothetical protein [Candidatus Hydrogenedentota bacterium]